MMLVIFLSQRKVVILFTVKNKIFKVDILNKGFLGVDQTSTVLTLL